MPTEIRIRLSEGDGTKEQRNVWRKMLCSASLVILVGEIILYPPNQHSWKGTCGKSFSHNPQEHPELSVGREGKWESADMAEYSVFDSALHFQESHFQPLNVFPGPPQVLNLLHRVQECCYY